MFAKSAAKRFQLKVAEALFLIIAEPNASGPPMTGALRSETHNVTFERISPADIFERDGWFCRECGRQTPKDKRGSYDDDAPELDHIIPISKGGAHTWNNLQCLCRSCNGLKSASMPNRRLLNRRKSEMKVDEAQKWLVF